MVLVEASTPASKSKVGVTLAPGLEASRLDQILK
jgi:hypothetical protein